MTPSLPPSPKPIWPRSYLLELYAQAVRSGCIRVDPIDQLTAKSLVQSFYRLRRRSDTNTASFLLPEYQLITASAWSPEHNGCLYFIFNKLPDSLSLPAITATSPPDDIGFAPADPSPIDNLEVADIDINNFLASIRKSAADRHD